MTTLACLALFAPLAAPGQNFLRSVHINVGESFRGQNTSRFFFTNVPGAGTLRGHQLTMSRSGSSMRASSANDAAALRFSAKSRADAGGVFDQVGSSTASGYGGFSIADTLNITSASLPAGSIRSATARVRLLLTSEQQLTGSTNLENCRVDITMHNWLTQFQTWSTNSLNGLPSGTFFADTPALVNGPNTPPSMNQLFLYATAGSSARAGYEPSTGAITPAMSASCSVTVTWGGIASLTLDDGTVIHDFHAQGATRADYTGQRFRKDQVSLISQAGPSLLGIQWAGTTNIFYQVQSASSLDSGFWTPEEDAIEGNGANFLLTPFVPAGNRFYRVTDAPLP